MQDRVQSVQFVTQYPAAAIVISILSVGVGLLLVLDLRLAILAVTAVASILLTLTKPHLALWTVLAFYMIVPEGTPLERAFRIPNTPFLVHEAMYGVTLFGWFIGVATGQLRTSRSAYALPVLAFCGYLVFAVVRGVQTKGFNAYDIAAELKAWSLYPLLVVGPLLLREGKKPWSLVLRTFIRMLVLLSGIGASVQLIAWRLIPESMLFAVELPRLGMGLPVRVISLTDRVYTLSLLTAFLAVVAERSSVWKNISLLCLLPITAKLAVSSSRTVVFDLVGTASLAFLFLQQSPMLRRQFLQALGQVRAWPVVIFACLSVGLLLVSLESTRFFLFRLGLPVQDQLDAFLAQREFLFGPPLSLFYNSPILGGGIGTRFYYVLEGFNPTYSSLRLADSAYVDGLFVTLLAKVGLIGLFMFALIYIVALRDFRWFLRRDEVALDLLISLFITVFGAFICVKLIGGVFSAELGYFRVIAVYLTAMGLLHMLRRELERALQTTEEGH